jgi:hypothetical protein
LSGIYDTSWYLAYKSDLVALLVPNHQVSVQNRIIHAAVTGSTSLHWRNLSVISQSPLVIMIKPLVRGMPEGFDSHPLSLREYTYQRFIEILAGRDHSAA